MKNKILFNNLNPLCLEDTKKEIKVKTTNIFKIKEIKKVYAEKCDISINDYSIIFCKNQCNLYEIMINAIVDSYTNIVGIPHIICSTMSHPDIIMILNKIEKKTHTEISYAAVDIYGQSTTDEITRLIKSNTALIMVPYINYLIGTVNNIKDIAELAHAHRIPLFCDSFIYGRLMIKSDIFTTNFGRTNLCLLIIKKELIDGYKLMHYADELRDGAERIIKIDEKDYRTVMQILLSKEFNQNYIKINTGKIFLLRKYLIESLSKCKKSLYYYDSIIETNTMPNKNDVVILGNAAAIPNVISFINMSQTTASLDAKLKKKYIYIYRGDSKIFENIGILNKWTKHIVTLNLDNCTKADITEFCAAL
jgi:hypothetical protein